MRQYRSFERHDDGVRPGLQNKSRVLSRCLGAAYITGTVEWV